MIKSGSDRPRRLASTVILARYAKKCYFDDKSKTTKKFENMMIHEFLGHLAIYNFALGLNLRNLTRNRRKFYFCDFLGQKLYFKPVNPSWHG